MPTSLALVGEYAPAKARGKLMGLTQAAWNLGPVVVLVLSALAPLGLLGARRPTSSRDCTQAAALALSCAGLLFGIVATVFVFMRFADHSHRTRKLMWGTGGTLQVVAYALYLVLPFSVPVILANIILFGVGAALAAR